MSTLRRLLEMIRFSHTIFALPFALLSAVMAWTTLGPNGERVEFSWLALVGILVCMVGARSAAMAFNRWADRRIDAANPRTATRHLPAGLLTSKTVLLFLLASVVVFELGTLLFLPNRLPLYLSLPVLAFLCGYSLTKRFTALAHFWLGAALMLAPISAWIALRGAIVQELPLDLLPALLIGAAVLLWVSGFDIIYACQDAEFDAAQGLHSVPAKLGVRGALRLAALCHFGMVGLLAAFPWLCPQIKLSWIYLAGIVAVGLLLIYEHAIVRPDDLSRVNVAFFQVNALVSIGLLILTSVDLLT